MVRDRIRIETLLAASSTLDGHGGEMQPTVMLDHHGGLVARNLSAGPGIRNDGVRSSVMIRHLRERGHRQWGCRARSTVSPAPNEMFQRTPTTVLLESRRLAGAAEHWC